MIDTDIQVSLRQKFNPENSILRLHQLRMLEMLKVIDQVCKDNNITYWLSSGTCLGAIRHGGFIPWDDDLDIEMYHKDYRRFVKLMKRLSLPNIVFQTHGSDCEYFAPYGKIRDQKSLIEEFNKHDIFYKYRGVYIDVFAVERNGSRILSRISGGLINRIVFPLSKIHNKYLRRIFTQPLYFLFAKCTFPVLSMITYPIGKKLRISHGSGFVVPRYEEDILPTIEVPFEGVMLPVPHNYHHYLSVLYGDYMKIPDMNNLHTHSSNVKLY
ncbi:MAG: LicD family protein [Muribaculaceae bacterium]|nr:LicD family protein [Muribaculaceae bacterium]